MAPELSVPITVAPEDSTKPDISRKALAYAAILHVVLLSLCFLHLPVEQPESIQVIPVSFVTLSDRTISPPEPNKSVTPQAKAGSPVPPQTPLEARPVDPLDVKLHALAQLRAPSKADQFAQGNAGLSDDAAARDDTASRSDATYAVRDYIRAQAERRWNLDLSILGNRRYLVRLLVEISSSGVVEKVEILDKTLFAEDHAFHEIALSARNAILLSSPFALPPGRYEDQMSMTLSFNPRDVLQ